jgi:hypothetical protein
MHTGKVSLEILTASNLADVNPSLRTFLQIKIDGCDVFQTETYANSFNPFDHQDEGILFNKIQYRQQYTPSTFSKESQDIIRNLLKKTRLGCKHDIDWTNLEQGEVTPPFTPTSVY